MTSFRRLLAGIGVPPERWRQVPPRARRNGLKLGMHASRARCRSSSRAHRAWPLRAAKAAGLPVLKGAQPLEGGLALRAVLVTCGVRSFLGSAPSFYN
ncbi:uncharacterized protein PITG_20777 [Phytophthora infestans T30-4]|uniref:Uncharacterized protein n=1 Tax=Phytophthora infestans (strain T30-4) TaxID=403677 RepID=D0P300_PHYIT|nr:uncharacterized protein PITG_20777 [Phytophthora infestans T30-4]EEY58526.1 hypothetical protein PITG_20777 [Phytophthora infestans T30-4]|eukprot:XP_002895338.1 hypothetical protein PITG_20777 [Phytophthora infestans T30-4]